MPTIDASTIISTLTFAYFLAMVNERIFESFIKPIIANSPISDYKQQVAVMLGLLLSISIGVDFITPIAEASTGLPLVFDAAGLILSGIIVGGGSNIVHFVIDWVASKSQTVYNN